MSEPGDPRIHKVLSSAGSIYRMRGGYKFVLLWAVFASIWIITTATLFGLFYYLPKSFDTTVIGTATVVTMLLGIPVLVLAFLTIYVAYNGYKRFKVFIYDFYPIWLGTRLELSTPIETDLTEKIIDMIKGAMPRFKKSGNGDVSLRYPSLKSFDIVLKSKREIALSKVIHQKEMLNEVIDTVSNSKNIPRKLRVKLLVIVLDVPIDANALMNMKLMKKWPRDAALVIMDNVDGNVSVKKIIPPKAL